MPAPTRSKLAVTPDAYDWISRTIRRKAEFADKLQLQPKTRQMVSNFAAKFDMPPEVQTNGEYVLETTRVEIRFLEEMASADARTLRTIVLPNYEAKQNAAGAKKALEQASLLEDVVSRVQAVMNGGSKK